ncbi:MAG: winged helix-turn-helix transcriptional regulator [Nitrososphaerales archaeon]
MDRTDIALCLFLMSNSRTPYHELAGKLGLSINAVHKRIKVMIDAGIIRTFTARESLVSLKAISVWVYGRSEAAHPGEIRTRLKNDESTYWVANSGGGYIYVGGYLRNLSELDSYVAFVKKEGEIGEPTVGIIPQLTSRFPAETLRPLDYQILASLHKDARKPVTDVASEIRASAKTVHRRLERMMEKGLVDLSIDWYPDASNDIVSICHVSLAQNADRAKVTSSLKERFQNILIEVLFSNLPNMTTLFLWTNSMRQMDDLRESIGKEEGVESVVMNVLQIGYMFDTWRDRLSLKDGERGNEARG